MNYSKKPKPTTKMCKYCKKLFPSDNVHFPVHNDRLSCFECDRWARNVIKEIDAYYDDRRRNKI